MKARQLLLATGNQGKAREMRALLAIQGVDLIDLGRLGLTLDIEEGSDYAANARLKASTYALASGLWTIADDSGLEVDALEGAPGPHSARLAGPHRTDADRRAQLLSLLRPHRRPWTARFRCTAALADPAGDVSLAEGVCPGEVIPEERGAGGFGYDPIFLITPLARTMAELDPAEKNSLSHRARAIHALLPVLRVRMGLDEG